MHTKNLGRLIPYLKQEAFKLSIFLVSIYGFTFVILQPPSQAPVPPSPVAIPTISVSLQSGSIRIPGLDLTAPLMLVESTIANDFIEPLQKGVALFPSALPGHDGTAIILGHSAPLGWPHINYDWVFSDLQKLKQGDKIMVTFENTEHTYTVDETAILQRGQEIPATYLAKNTSRILLISCWPPGIDNKRIGVVATIDKI
ncbi:MAG: sortase [bacterium]|nr:sortase [bacterium]